MSCIPENCEYVLDLEHQIEILEEELRELKSKLEWLDE